jgi:hypothetical protein
MAAPPPPPAAAQAQTAGFKKKGNVPGIPPPPPQAQAAAVPGQRRDSKPRPPWVLVDAKIHAKRDRLDTGNEFWDTIVAFADMPSDSGCTAEELREFSVMLRLK